MLEEPAAWQRYTMLEQVVRANKEIKGWYRYLPLSYLLLPSRMPPRHGFPTALTKGLLHRQIRFELRRGLRVECRFEEVHAFFEVFALGVYQVPLDWAAMTNIIDVGANVGAATLWFASMAPKAAIISVEPSQQTEGRLANNVRLNGLSDRVNLENKAMAPESGTIYFNESTTSGNSFTTADKGETAVAVEAISLPDLITKYGLSHIDLLKLDCEGAEYALLENLPSSLFSIIRNVVGEYHPNTAANIGDLERIFRKEGYEFASKEMWSGTGLFFARR
jgi:FkbM family methyltransferase